MGLNSFYWFFGRRGISLFIFCIFKINEWVMKKLFNEYIIMIIIEIKENLIYIKLRILSIFLY